ncbi:MAG: hypothetical protein IPM58_14275 [Nitrospira sp.]|nr:hypothetical protein [Nitrospira sp.]
MTMLRMTGKNVWSIVLAGGDGERVKPLVLRWLGRHRPKQYCTFVGTRSMFERTLNRAALIASPKRTVVVAARHHRSELRNQLFAHLTHKMIEQPLNRDTAAGLFLPISYVRARDPQAMVVIQPSDHFVYPERRFVEAVRQGVASAEAIPDRLGCSGFSRIAWRPNMDGFNGAPSSKEPPQPRSMPCRPFSKNPILQGLMPHYAPEACGTRSCSQRPWTPCGRQDGPAFPT